MADQMVCCIMEAVQAATGMDFDGEEAARERLKIPERMKGGGIRRATETRYPAFLGALLDVLPRCIDMTDGGQRGMHPWLLRAAIDGVDWGRSIRHRGPEECTVPERDGRGTLP